MIREPIRFFLPGPTYVLEEVRRAMLRPMAAHRSPEFKAVFASLAERLPKIFRTSGPVYQATSSATFLMEASVRSLTRHRVLNLTSGAFSERWHQVCLAQGLEADRLAVPWGQAVDPELVRRTLVRARSSSPYGAVTVVHSETSTGVLNPVAEIAAVVREESDALILVDAVSSLAGVPFETDAWGIDLVFVGTQKAFALPPGLTLFALSPRAQARAEELPHRGFYSDLLRYRDYHARGGPITTPALPQVWALDFQADRILAEGLEERWQRHEELAAKTHRWAEAHGFRYASAVDSPTVSCLHPPTGMHAADLVRRLSERGFTVGGGYGEFKERTLRIGHMGDIVLPDLEALLEAFGAVLREARAA